MAALAATRQLLIPYIATRLLTAAMALLALAIFPQATPCGTSCPSPATWFSMRRRGGTPARTWRSLATDARGTGSEHSLPAALPVTHAGTRRAVRGDRRWVPCRRHSHLERSTSDRSSRKDAVLFAVALSGNAADIRRTRAPSRNRSARPRRCVIEATRSRT